MQRKGDRRPEKMQDTGYMILDTGCWMCRPEKSRIPKFRMTLPEHPISNKEHPTFKCFESAAE
jgi:hypothetical protein